MANRGAHDERRVQRQTAGLSKNIHPSYHHFKLNF